MHLQVFVNANVFSPIFIKSIKLVCINHGECEHRKSNHNDPKHIHHSLPNAPRYLLFENTRKNRITWNILTQFVFVIFILLFEMARVDQFYFSIRALTWNVTMNIKNSPM